MPKHLLVAVVAMAFAGATIAFGHGTPIHVGVVDNGLVVSNGEPDTLGFAKRMYVEDDDEGDFWTETESTPLLMLWQVPGFEIFGMDDLSNLSLQVLRRPVAGSSPAEERNLWYWNDLTEALAPAPAGFDLHLLARFNQSVPLTAADAAAPPPLLISDPMTGQTGSHKHNLLLYALDNETTPPSGAYGFFARLTSTWYQPSDPFLVVINRGVDYEKMIPAALAINAAANAEPIPGDYDGNGQLQLADYQFWRERYGNLVAPFASPDGNGNGVVDAADYIVWRAAFGQPAAGAFASTAVPEASGFVLTMAALLFLSAVRRHRRLSRAAIRC